MNRTDIINVIARNIQAKSYLEIGVDNCVNFNKINCKYKIGVDPKPQAKNILGMTSDDFFKQNEEKFDLIFIDGLHVHDQVYRDITNALDVLNPGGYIICHDMNPITEERQRTPWVGGEWNGDCWKAFVNLRCERDDLEMITVDTDEGVSIIKRGSQTPLVIETPLLYTELDKNRKSWLNLKSESEFQSMYMQNNLVSLIEKFSLDPNNPENNFAVAREYDILGQFASAVSFYIRTAERTEDQLLRYECLILAALCFEKQGTRRFTVKGMLQHAVAIQPKRPEGYYLLSLFYEHEKDDGKWFNTYLMASIGLECSDFDNLVPLRNKVYPGKHALYFQKGHSAWWCGLKEESLDIFLNLYASTDLDDDMRKLVYNNLVIMGAFASKKLNLYDKSKLNRLKLPFEGAENIEQNYSEAYQDMFVLGALKGKRNGTYVEIGSGDPIYGNNTYLLEKEFGWSGLSLDISEEFVKAHKEKRDHMCLLKDATATNYDALFSAAGFDEVIDYLQIDCDPPSVSFKALLAIPLEKYKFRVITFEHDHYADPHGGFREKARNYLNSQGYNLYVSNISPDNNRPYEDWYVNSDLVNGDVLTYIKAYERDETTKKAENFMLKG